MSTEPTRFSELPLRPVYQAHEDRLQDFYIPVLRLSVSYDRLVGYWRSSSLAVAAAGLSRFIRNALADGGRMRVIASARLTNDDIVAIVGGEPLEDAVAGRLLEGTSEATDVVVEERLRFLAWMVREGLLEVKVAIPTDDNGQPLGAEETDRLFHTKFGVLTDRFGDRIAFQGSLNESAQGWVHNHEAFNVFRSWRTEVWEEYGQPWEDAFRDHWDSTGPIADWLILDLPEAVRADLVGRVPVDWVPPEFDPAESFGDAHDELAKIADEPRMAVGGGVAFSTLPIEPWPHQLQIASRIVDTWPRSYLLADEVGLGKTIEAGMVVRELILSGKAGKVLLLVPASVQRQWQEELWEKFCIDVPSLQRGKFFNYAGEEVVAPAGTSPWSAFPIVLASSHLARMRRNRQAVVDAGPWDLVLVDEAHHARRRGIGGRQGANQLLQLLRDMRDAHSWKALVLATATPMQMNTHDIYDLLDLFGLPGSWGSGEAAFESYYRQLAEPDPKARDWFLLRRMLGDFLTQDDVRPNPIMQRRVAILPGPARMRVENLHRYQLDGSTVAAQDAEERALIDQWLRANTPIRDRVFRSTRAALREYQRQGLLGPQAVIPRRTVTDAMIDFDSEEERRLYRRVEDYISRYYQKYDQDNKTRPLGFIMTVYRRRLTSSLQAIHRSLRRRLDSVHGQIALDQLLDDDDLFALESQATFDYDDLSEQAIPYAEELEELRGFIEDLEKAIPNDTKGRRVSEQVKQAFLAGHKSMVIFTQFTDTLEWLREQLVATFGKEVATFTGKGGERWDPEARTWARLSKEEVKELFRSQEVRILIGTDAMSEGLNLQTTDYLINYDMPWNFMRVEQRIGRVDRINGQPLVHVTNYFYRDTVEEQVYSGIAEDAEWFRQVVGPAQPVLGQVEAVIERLAMKSSGEERDQAVRDELDEVRQAIATYQQRPLTLGTLEPEEPVSDDVVGTVFGLAQIEEILLRNPLTAPLMHTHPDFSRTYLVELDGKKHAMTLDREVYDKNPDIGFLTYGHPVFEALLRVGS